MTQITNTARDTQDQPAGAVTRLRKRTVSKAIAVTIGVLALVGVTGVGPASAVITTSRTGSVGRLIDHGYAVCYRITDNSDTGLDAPKTWVGRAPSYSNSTQTIWAINRVEYWTGTQWLLYRWGQWQSVRTTPGQRAVFGAEDLRVSQADLQNGFTNYRLATLYYWQVGQTTIGQVTNYYEFMDYKVSFGSTMYPPEVAQTNPGQSSWCEF
jgi:hypothetical protein